MITRSLAAVADSSPTQFMAISDAQVGDGADMLVNPRLPWDEAARPRPAQRRRAASLQATRDAASRALVDRMKPTFDYSLNGFKPNIRTKHIHAPFVTLKELLLKLPPNVAFDVELSKAQSSLHMATQLDLSSKTLSMNHFLTWL